MPVFEKNVAPLASISLEMRDGSGAFVSGTPTVTVSVGGAAYGTAFGTLTAISGATGEWEYLPTQAETNAGKFKVKAVLSGAVTLTREILPEPSYTTALSLSLAKVGRDLIGTGTCGASTSTTAVLTGLAGASLSPIGCVLDLYDASGGFLCSRVVTSWTQGTLTASVGVSFSTTPTSGSTVYVLRTGMNASLDGSLRPIAASVASGVSVANAPQVLPPSKAGQIPFLPFLIATSNGGDQTGQTLTSVTAYRNGVVFTPGTAITMSETGTSAYRLNMAAADFTAGSYYFKVVTNGGYVAKIEIRAVAALDYDATNLGLTDLSSALNAQGLTATRAGYLDTLNGLVASVWSYATRTLTAGQNFNNVGQTTNLPVDLSGIPAAVWGYVSRTLTAVADSSGVSTLLARLTAGRAANLDNLDAAITSRPTADGVWSATTRTLTALGVSVDTNPNAVELAIKAKTDHLPDSPASTSDVRPIVTVSVPSILPGYSIPDGDLPTIRRGDSWSAALTGLGSLTGRTKLWATAKRDPRRADAFADFALTELGYLVTIAGSAPVTAQAGALVVTDATNGAVVLVLSPAATAALGPGELAFDIQMLAGGQVKTLATGRVEVVADVTRAVG